MHKICKWNIDFQLENITTTTHNFWFKITSSKILKKTIHIHIYIYRERTYQTAFCSQLYLVLVSDKC